MSAIATALKRSVNKNGTVSEPVADDAAVPQADAATAAPVQPATEPVDSAALSQLLAELNSHSLALVPYRQARGQLALPAEPRPMRLESILLWMLTTVLLAVVFSTITIKYLTNDRSPRIVTTIPSHEVSDPTALIGQQQKEFSDLAVSVARLTSALSSSAVRMNRLEAGQARLQRRGESAQSNPKNTRITRWEDAAKSPQAQPVAAAPATHAAAPAATTVTPAPPPAAVATPAPAVVAPPAAAPAAAPAPASTSVATPTAAPGLPITGLDMVHGAVEHRAPNGATDYWLAPRGDGKSTRMVRVRPFATSLQGVWVHNLDERQDYILTQSGGWIPQGSVPAIGN